MTNAKKPTAMVEQEAIDSLTAMAAGFDQSPTWFVACAKGCLKRIAALRALEPAAPVEDGEDVEWPKAKCGNHLDRFPCQECRARVPAECPRYERDYAQPPAADALVRSAYIEGHRHGRANPPVYQSAEEDWQQSRSRAALAKLQGGGANG